MEPKHWLFVVATINFTCFFASVYANPQRTKDDEAPFPAGEIVHKLPSDVKQETSTQTEKSLFFMGVHFDSGKLGNSIGGTYASLKEFKGHSLAELISALNSRLHFTKQTLNLAGATRLPHSITFSGPKTKPTRIASNYIFIQCYKLKDSNQIVMTYTIDTEKIHASNRLIYPKGFRWTSLLKGKKTVPDMSALCNEFLGLSLPVH